jgi:DNA-binding transcriptional LysR family regulator
MRLRQIEDFIAVVESGGIRAAARTRGISQPAMTRSLRELEAHLGTHLVHRTPQGILLTASGRQFFIRVRAAHTELRRAEADAAGAGSAESIALGVGPTAGVLLVPEAVGGLRKQFPRARIRIIEGIAQQLGPLVKDGTLDFAVTGQRQLKDDSGLACRPLFTHQLVVAARKGHPLRHARSLTELAEAEWVSLYAQGSEPSIIRQAFATAGLPVPTHAIQCESYRILIALLTQSDMLAVITGRLLSKMHGGESLEAIPVAEKLPSNATHLVTRAGVPLSRPAALLARLVLQAGRRLAKAA